MPKDYFKVVITGDVDAGKSTLIGRILFETKSVHSGALEEIMGLSQDSGSNPEFAYLLDSFSEERQDKLTIDSTQVFCKINNKLKFIFIDVPGHKELIKNMLCGSTYADRAVIVIDSCKSVTEQTRRHAFILSFLGVKHFIIAVNKMDAVNYEEKLFNNICRAVFEITDSLMITRPICVPVVAKTGDNIIKHSKKMSWYKAKTLWSVLSELHKENTLHNFVFPVQDSYDFGPDKVCVGRIVSGRVKVNDEVLVLPQKRFDRVKRIVEFGSKKSSTKANKSIGLLMYGSEPLKRGQVICFPGDLKVSDRLNAKVFFIKKINPNMVLNFECSTQDMPVRSYKINKIWDSATLELKKIEDIEETDVGEIEFFFEGSVVLGNAQDSVLRRFVLKSDNHIIGVGMIE
jgi:sulfate adenylyltransferase subunit 1 (EFTu-like GTPase family)